jgi:excinuclease ABC subunit B
VAILDADKEGFLRSERSLIQTCGRAARNINGMVIFYADQITGSIERAMDECNRRRLIQSEYNRENNITPTSIQKNIDDILGSSYEADYVTIPTIAEEEKEYITPEIIKDIISELQKKMKECAKRLEFEEAGRLRDEIKELKQRELDVRGG